MARRRTPTKTVKQTSLNLPAFHGDGQLGLGSTQFDLPPAIPDPQFDDPPRWFKRCATEARKLLSLNLAREQCQAYLKAGAGHNYGHLKSILLYPPVPERPLQDWYVILFTAYDLCFPITPLGDSTTTRPFKYRLVKYAESHPAALEQVLREALKHVRRNLQEGGDEIPPSDDGENELAGAKAKAGGPRSDTKSDTHKKIKKKLVMTAHAAQCAARYHRQKRIDATTTIGQIAEEYASEHKGARGASASYIKRVLNDNPEQLRKKK
jgi:hypothetical protein